MFAALIQERDPLQLEKFWDGLEYWVQVAGGFAAAALLLWLLYRMIASFTPQKAGPTSRVMDLAYAAVISAYIAYAVVTSPQWLPAVKATLAGEAVTPVDPKPSMVRLQNNILTGAGILALAVVSLTLIKDMFGFRLRSRRIWAVARLSMKEAVRRRVLWVFLLILLVYLFGSWFQESSNPQDQVRNYLATLYFAETPLLLVAAVLLAAFSIPTDIKQQTIHTILTKPVERFEIVLGRFLGYMLLMTFALLVMTVLSLGYVFRSISPEAQNESLKAREPGLGELEFEGTESKQKGVNVGHEWDYRSYISGPNPPMPIQYAFWNFRDLPADLANRDNVVCEFTFDVYRTTKGQENRGVFCTFQFETWHYDKAKEKEYDQAVLEERRKPTPDFGALAEKYGFYELKSVEVTDFHTQSLELPGGLFKNALEGKPAASTAGGAAPDVKPRLRVRVHCDSRSQYVGMAKYDLYLRLDSLDPGADRRRFAINFFKGAFGLWLRLGLVTGLAVTFSTYLSGIISALLVLFLYIGGFFQDYIQTLALGTAPGGGPLESLYRLVQRENMLVPLEQTAAVKIATGYDTGFRWFLRRVLDIIPDVDRFDFTDKVAEGFSISGTEMFLNFLLLVAYLIPLAILAYHLIKSREIASS
ncbi:MAG: ABC transporter permease [Gemmataceae bacterium]